MDKKFITDCLRLVAIFFIASLVFNPILWDVSMLAEYGLLAKIVLTTLMLWSMLIVAFGLFFLGVWLMPQGERPEL